MVLDALATGAGSVVPLAPSVRVGVISGWTVDRASGSRRVRNSVEACRYVLEILDGVLRAEVDEPRDAIEDDSVWAGTKLSVPVPVPVPVGLKVAVYDPFKAGIFGGLVNCWGR